MHVAMLSASKYPGVLITCTLKHINAFAEILKNPAHVRIPNFPEIVDKIVDHKAFFCPSSWSNIELIY